MKLSVPYGPQNATLIVSPNVTHFSPTSSTIEGPQQKLDFQLPSSPSHVITTAQGKVRITLKSVAGKAPHNTYEFEVVPV